VKTISGRGTTDTTPANRRSTSMRSWLSLPKIPCCS